MCLGESTTQNQYPPFLGEILNRQNNIKVKFSIIDKGMAGISTSGILANLEALLQQYRPDMVIVMMGINDLGRHMPQESFSTSKVTLFLRTFKTYNLLRILWLHIITKTKEIRAHYLRQDGQSSKKSQSSFLKTLQKEAYAGKTKTSLSSSQNPEITKQGPGSDITFFNQGKLYQIEDHFLQAEESFKKAIRLNPRYSMAYVGLGLLYQSKDKFSEAEAAFKKAIEINPEEWSAYIDLGGIYQEQDELALAEELYKRALQLNIKHNRLYGAIGTLYQESGNSELANEYFKKAEELRSKWHDPIVTNNYLKLKEMLDIKGIRLVCVQYPMLSIESLKKYSMIGKELYLWTMKKISSRQ